MGKEEDENKKAVGEGERVEDRKRGINRRGGGKGEREEKDESYM